jgi:hypothetical protein
MHSVGSPCVRHTQPDSATIPIVTWGGAVATQVRSRMATKYSRLNGSFHRVLACSAGGPGFDSRLRRNILRYSGQASTVTHYAYLFPVFLPPTLFSPLSPSLYSLSPSVSLPTLFSSLSPSLLSFALYPYPNSLSHLPPAQITFPNSPQPK